MGADLLADLAVALAEGRAGSGPQRHPRSPLPWAAERRGCRSLRGGRSLLVEPEDYLELVRSFLPSTA